MSGSFSTWSLGGEPSHCGKRTKFPDGWQITHTTVRKVCAAGGLSGRHTMAWGMLSPPKGVERKTMAAKPELEAFSDALKQAREDAGMSLRALAEAVEASHTVVAQWERGEHAPRPPRVALAPVGVLACRVRRCTARWRHRGGAGGPAAGGARPQDLDRGVSRARPQAGQG